ncbi:pentatricopeptide repeat domain-containing protein [Colletotrichum gloeosporioides Cg-14]|uniref:Pentatricopeptide repeat domain-containing protein n=1 Tax=Colletotrichum gloeosporioides (strain Cg-14) TaxID=1237896 RepID=T0LZ45_COLGC|nr:pentatricopeptide repeat domain-containing protein [Colletotrichum gloeosporioides Cg-14]
MIANIKSTLSSLQGGGLLAPFGVNDIDSIAKDFEAQFEGANTPEEMTETMDLYIKSLEKKLEEKGFDVSGFDDSNPIATLGTIHEAAQKDPSERRSDPIPQIPESAWNFNQRKRISRFNSVLKRTTNQIRRGEEPDAKTIQTVWKLYGLTRPTLSKSWASVPHEVWDILWQILSVDETRNPGRLTYLSMLARDLSENQIPLSPSQQLVTIEAMFVDGWDAKAIESWKRCMATLGDSGAENFQEFWELGVRMFCQKGDIVQAERAINKLLEQQLDPRIMVPLIRTCAADPAEESRQKAWDTYRRMRDLLGPSMGLEDYDLVISFFLITNQTIQALQVFVDMMFSGTVDVMKQDVLPSKIGNKFFFGKWLKRLIGAGDLDGAYSVFQLMQSKGIEAASIQINGLIGAWQRSGGADNLQLADSLAWSMIQSRIEFVKNRRRLSCMDGSARIVEVSDSHAELAAVPKATLETFSLLAENYRLRSLHNKLEELWDASREAEISPDAFMMNQLIESFSQKGDLSEAKEVYQVLVHKRQVKPDPYTFMALWKMLAINRLHTVTGDMRIAEIKNAREVFAETIRFAHVFEAEGFDGQFARKILHSFRRLKDNPGIVVALQTLKVVFDWTPPEMLTFEMLFETTSLKFDTGPARQKLRLAKRNMDAFVEAQPRQPGEPKTLEEMTQKQRGQEMSGYLQSKYIKEMGVVPEGLMEQTAEEMGVYDILIKKP